MPEDQADGTLAPEPASLSAFEEEIPVPDRGVADSARLRLAALRALSAEQFREQMPAGPEDDIRAVNAVVDATRSDAVTPADALDVGAALVVLCDLRLYLDCLEADLLDAAQQVDLRWDVIAAILGIPVEDVRRRHSALRARRDSR